MAQLGAPDEWLDVRLRAGAAIHNGGQKDNGPGVSYSGLTGNDLGFSAAAYPLSWLGAAASFQREAFSLTEAMVAVGNVSLIRFSLGPTFRWTLGPIRLEPGLEYAFAQVPVFNDSTSPVPSAATRHALMLKARAGATFGRVWCELNGELPIGLSASGAAVQATSPLAGGALGVGVRVDLVRLAPVTLGVRAEAQFVADMVSVTGGLSNQGVWRVGGGVEATFRDELPPDEASTGSLRVAVLGAARHEALEGAAISVHSPSVDQQATTDAQGTSTLSGLSVGAVEVTVRKSGFDAVTRSVEIVRGSEASLEISLAETPEPTGGLDITVTDAVSHAPLPEVVVQVGSARQTSDASGNVSFTGLKPGNVALDLRKPGYNPGSEAAMVASGKQTAVALTLTPERKKVPAIVSGLVRGAKDGSPVAAQLEIPEAGIKVKADSKGAFSMTVPPGTYTVSISAPGYIAQSKSVVLKEGERTIFNVDLFAK